MALIHTINIGGTQYDVKSTHYATSSTAAGTAAKTATIQNGSFTLAAGVKVSVKFTYANSASNPSLNINSTGAKTIRWRNANLSNDQYWSAAQVVDFVYDGTYWNVIGAINSGSADTSNLLKKTGDTMTGPLGLTKNVNYGDTFPTTGQTGQIFFLSSEGFEDLEDEGPSLPTGGTAGQILVKNSSADGDASWRDGDYLPLTGGTMIGQIINEINGTWWQGGRDSAPIRCVGTSADSWHPVFSCKTPDGDISNGILDNTMYWVFTSDHNYNAGQNNTTEMAYLTSGGAFGATSVYGAVWNDYAEYRICNENFIPGQVVCENGDDTLSIATKRLQPGANIVSDTFGFAIGETDEAKCPIAVSGRVLAYTYEPREEFKAGDAVCAGPNGTVSKMTREEIREYPERIIGTVSAIPSYETWGTGNVKINNRIWIKI